MRTRRLAPLAAIAAALFVAPAAHAEQVTATSGPVSATLNYETSHDGYSHSFGKLTIVRNGRTLYDQVPTSGPCKPARCEPTVGFTGTPPLRIRDLDGDGEPEVIVPGFTGGAHCCLIAQILALRPGSAGYAMVARDFGNGGFALRDLDGDGLPEFVSSDDRFAYAFTAYAWSGRPIMVSLYVHGTFVDMTKRFPAQVSRDARSFWSGYLDRRRKHDSTDRGQIAAWAADEYLLGKRASARTVLKREAGRGYLGKPASARAFIKRLDRFLMRAGYR